MRKCVAIIIMICLTASLLMSCGSGGGDKNEGAQSKTVTVKSSAWRIK